MDVINVYDIFDVRDIIEKIRRMHEGMKVELSFNNTIDSDDLKYIYYIHDNLFAKVYSK